MDVDAGASHPAAAQTTQTTQTAQAGQQPGAHEMMQLPAVLPFPHIPSSIVPLTNAAFLVCGPVDRRVIWLPCLQR